MRLTCPDYLRDHLENDQKIDSLLTFSRLAHAEPHIEAVSLSLLAQAVAVELKLSEPERRATFIIEEEMEAWGMRSFYGWL